MQVVPVCKQRPVSPVVPHMVHVSGRRAEALSGALPAERLPEQLTWPQVIRPDGQAIPAVPLGRFPPGGLFGLVFRAVSIPGQLPASGVPAGPGRLHGHGLSPPGKTKSAQALTPLPGGLGSGACRTPTLAQALVDIHDGLLPASLAVYRQVFGCRPWCQPQDLVLAAYRTEQPAIFHR